MRPSTAAPAPPANRRASPVWVVAALLALAPSLASADELTLGKALLEKGKAADAAKVLEKAVAGPKKDDAAAWLLLGQARIGTGELDRAVAALDASLAKKPTFDGHLYRGIALDMGDRSKEAAAAFEAASKLDPKRPEPHAFLGLARLSEGDAKGAVAALRKADELAPGKPEVLTDLGYALVRAGQPKEAVDVLKRALDKDGKNADALFNLGDAYAALGDDTKAIDSYERAVFRDAKHGKAQFHLGLLREKRKEHDAAIAAYRAALATDPGDEKILTALARAYEAAGKPDDAKKIRAQLDAGKKVTP